MTATAYTRKDAKAEADRLGVRYRITRDGEVHFYGTMPNSNVTGWYLAGYAEEKEHATA